jgi:hypothetical protein
VARLCALRQERVGAPSSRFARRWGFSRFLTRQACSRSLTGFLASNCRVLHRFVGCRILCRCCKGCGFSCEKCRNPSSLFACRIRFGQAPPRAGGAPLRAPAGARGCPIFAVCAKVGFFVCVSSLVRPELSRSLSDYPPGQQPGAASLCRPCKGCGFSCEKCCNPSSLCACRICSGQCVAPTRICTSVQSPGRFLPW